MSIHLYISLFLLINTIIIKVNSQNATQQYVIRRDLIRGYKAAEFSVYDATGKHVNYRIESKYHLFQNIKIIAYPSKKEIARLQAKLHLITYKAEISILDPQSNEWVSGTVEQNFKLVGALCNIDWNGHRIIMEHEIFSFTSTFRDGNGDLLAKYRIRPASLFWANKYDMQIFSNKYPTQIYFLGLAAHDRILLNQKSR